jgi:hypothetical protein
MTRRPIGLAAALTVVVLASACDQPPPSALQTEGPLFKPVASQFACLFTGNPSLSNSANAYFQTTADRKNASDLIALMQDGYTASGPSGARDAGYSLLALEGAASRDASRAGSVDVGETMAKQDINCMFNTDNATDFADWPDDAQYDFSKALDAPHGGAFFVRGGITDPAAAAAIGNIASLNTGLVPAGGNVSAIAPPLLPDPNPLNPPIQVTWPEVLTPPGGSPTRTLIYGLPVTDGFDWKLVGRNTVFTPYAVVLLCQGVHPGVEFFADADVVLQKGIGALGLQQAGNVCGTLPPFALGDWRRSGILLANRLLIAADRLLAPEPLHATAAAVGTSTLIGGASGAKGDEFVVLNLPTVTLKFTLPKAGEKPKVVTGRISATVNVTIPLGGPEGGNPAGGIKVSLTTATNNGTGTAVYEITQAGKDHNYLGCNPNDNPANDPPWVVPPQKITLGTVGTDGTTQETNAVWTNNLCFTKSGSVQLVGTSVSDGNLAAGIGSAMSVKVGVIP